MHCLYDSAVCAPSVLFVVVAVVFSRQTRTPTEHLEEAPLSVEGTLRHFLRHASGRVPCGAPPPHRQRRVFLASFHMKRLYIRGPVAAVALWLGDEKRVIIIIIWKEHSIRQRRHSLHMTYVGKNARLGRTPASRHALWAAHHLPYRE